MCFSIWHVRLHDYSNRLPVNSIKLLIDLKSLPPIHEIYAIAYTNSDSIKMIQVLNEGIGTTDNYQ